MLKCDNRAIISIHALLAESDSRTCKSRPASQKFLSTLSLRRATKQAITAEQTARISIHALLAESDYMPFRMPTGGLLFLSTLSLRRATTRSALCRRPHDISIHALLAESDSPKCVLPWMTSNFYPRSPCGERQQVTFWQDIDDRISIHALLAESDPITCCLHMRHAVFLSTLSLRRATDIAQHSRHLRLSFLSTLSLRRATECRVTDCSRSGISIHALLAESDCFLSVMSFAQTRFLSTLSLRRATSICQAPTPPCNVFLSTLSLRRATHQPRQTRHCKKYFYPRSPCGERHPILLPRFQPGLISIHALLAESDRGQNPGPRKDTDFYPRSPCGERRAPRWIKCRHPPFLSTLSLRRATRGPRRSVYCPINFYPRSPCGERHDFRGQTL